MQCIGKLLSHNNFSYEHRIYDSSTIFITTLANMKSFTPHLTAIFVKASIAMNTTVSESLAAF